MLSADSNGHSSCARPEASVDPLPQRLQQARVGCTQTIGLLIDSSRDYLLLMANRELIEDLRSKVSPSDIVQETCVRAFERFEQFQGNCEEEWLAWLRQILQRQLGAMRRRYVEAEIRNVRRETELSAEGHQPIDSDTPSRDASRREGASRIERALARLPAQYQLVLQLREWELLPFHEVGQRLNRSEDAARQLWYRALDRLSQELVYVDRSR